MSQYRVQRVAKVAGNLAVACACLLWVTGARADTPNMPVVVAWGNNSYGQTSVPTDLTGVTQIAAGYYHTVALKNDGTVVAWGYNGYGQTSVPADLTGVTQIAAGEAHTVALKNDGTVVAWGYNVTGQTTVPTNLTSVTYVAAGAYHTVALKNDGTVVAWGYNGSGQTSVPTNLIGVTQVAAGWGHTVALKNDGTVVAWGYNGYGQTSVPANLTGVTQVAAGGDPMSGTSVALKNDGTVVVWGSTYYATSVPTNLTGVTQVAAGSGYVVALKYSGTVVAWGANWQGQTSVPTNLTGVTQVAAGLEHTVALVELDCNNDGLLDSEQIAANPALDLNGNAALDTCELARGFEEDCDQNGVIDSVEQNLNQLAAADSGPLARIGTGHSQQWVYATPSLSLDEPTLTITAYGDFSAPGETLSVSLNGRFVGTFYATGSDKNDCRAFVQRTITLPRAFYNECVAAPGGAMDAIFDFTTSVAVNADQCPSGSWVRAQISYTASVAGDCNANSLLDVCEIALDASIDANTDGVIDACQGMGVVFLCPGDLDGGGSVDTADLSLLLMSFGAAMPGDPADLDASGQIDTADLSLMLLSFGDC